MKVSSVAAVGVGVAAAVGFVQGAPGLTSLPVVRRRWPQLEGRGRPGHVALTFDDGPDPQSTPQVLDVLDDLGVRATFFCLGDMVQRAPTLTRELADAGHELALHGWHHRNSLGVGPLALRRSLVRALDLIEECAGVRPVRYRPPYGVVTASTVWAARSLGLSTVLWGAWGVDWAADATPASVLRELAPDLAGGGTILLHDSDCTSSPGSWRATVGALRPLVEDLRGRGLEVGPLAQH
jgi:peptidoglycan/xylan/chitin deacetylase (PgdA/CDA1 family)